MVLFIMLCKVAITFDGADEILKCEHSNRNLLVLSFESS